MYSHYVVVLDWALENDSEVEIRGVAHTLDDAEIIFDRLVKGEKRLAAENKYTIEEDTKHVFSAGIMGSWRDNHIELYIQGVN